MSPETVRETNRRFFFDLRQDYDRVEPDAWSGEQGSLAWINGVKAVHIQGILEAVTNFQEDALREAWSSYMALTAGVHLWPDANHRTGMVTFGIAAEEAFDLDVAMNPQDAEEMVLRSKAWRNARHSPITAHELRIVDHPYRQLFREFEGRLDVEPI